MSRQLTLYRQIPPGHDEHGPPLDLAALLVPHTLPHLPLLQLGLGDRHHVQLPPLQSRSLNTLTSHKSLSRLNALPDCFSGDNVRVTLQQLVQVGLAPRVGVRVAECELVSLLVSVEGECE